MVVKIKEIENPLAYEASIKCPNCGNITKIDVEWGWWSRVELNVRPICCAKCGHML